MSRVLPDFSSIKCPDYTGFFQHTVPNTQWERLYPSVDHAGHGGTQTGRVLGHKKEVLVQVRTLCLRSFEYLIDGRIPTGRQRTSRRRRVNDISYIHRNSVHDSPKLLPFMQACGKACHESSSVFTTCQKSETLPLKLQSPSDHFLTGSLFGPPCSPVVGLTSPSNSEATGFRASGCSASSASASSLPTDVCERGACALRTRSSNSRWSSLGRGGGDGRFSEFDLDLDDEKRGCGMDEGMRAAFRRVLCRRGALRATLTTNLVSLAIFYNCEMSKFA